MAEPIWNVESLKAHIEAVLTERDKAIAIALAEVRGRGAGFRSDVSLFLAVVALLISGAVAFLK